MPARQALADGLISTDTSLLDYGSGRGQDVRRLRLMGYPQAVGWDPHYANDAVPESADTVLMSYVLNVIENREERRKTLLSAWGLTQRVLVAAVRLTWDRRRVTGTEMADGVLTSRATFQHLFSVSELRALVEDVTGVRCVARSPGLVYAFREERDRLHYIARSSLPQFTWAAPEDLAGAVREAVAFTHAHGRLPAFEEIPHQVLPVLGHLSRQALSKVIRKAVDPVSMSGGSRRATLDVLLLLGIGLFEGRPRLGDLPLTTQLDIRTHFSSYREACRRADRLLLKLRDDSYVRGAMRNSVGKLTPTALYVHRRARDDMPVVLRLYEYCGSVAAGRPIGWNVVKLHHDTRRVSWSSYPEFDSDPHPALAWTYGVELANLKASFRSYEDGSNRPLLHRKHEFLSRDDSDFAKYERLTRAEVRAGLYEDPSRIGLERGWAETLEANGVYLRGHRLLRRTDG